MFHKFRIAIYLALAFLCSCCAAYKLVAEEPLRNLDSHCPFTPPKSLEVWQARAAQLKLQIQTSVGLLPPPLLDPVKPQIYNRRELDGYVVESCIFESLPGMWVTGSLYRPTGLSPDQKVPGVLCPHGHWPNGRFYEANDVPAQLASGAERFEAAAINPIQARCVQLARMGCVVYQYDMLGYADSQQIPSARSHGFSSQAADSEVNGEGWLLYSPLAESHLQSIMGLQTLASMRGLDMLLTLPEVDSSRIAITGASGGGTQTFLLAALDPRVSLAFPAVMVSTGMQGGCVCENCPLLRTGTGNVEIAALFAPKPMGMTAADDWTRTMPTDGFPELQQLYQLYGAKDKVALFPSLHFGHNYNHVSRVSMYGWINDHFGLGLKKPILERDFQRLTASDLSVFDAQHPQPEGGESFERKLLKQWTEIVDLQMQGWLQGDEAQNRQLAETLQHGWQAVLGLTTGSARPTQAATLAEGAGNESQITVRIGDANWHYTPIDTEQSLVQYKRLAASYTYGYNLSRFAFQAHQLARAFAELRQQHPQATIEVSASGGSGALAAAALFVSQELAYEAGQSPSGFSLVLPDSNFRFASAKSIRDAYFLPGSARYWDLPGLLACLNVDTKLHIATASDNVERLSRLRNYMARQ